MRNDVLGPRGRRMAASLLLVALVVVGIPVASAGGSPAEMTQKDFKAMRIKELRQFLEIRGLTCAGCNEKGDFVKMAYSNRHVVPIASRGRREIPAGTLWDVWAANARTACEAAAARQSFDVTEEPHRSICEAIFHGVEGLMMQHGKRVANKLKKTPKDVLKTSYSGVYYDAGERLINSVASYCFSVPSTREECQSLAKVTALLEGRTKASIDLTLWLTNVGIENVNVMNDIVGDRRDDL